MPSARGDDPGAVSAGEAAERVREPGERLERLKEVLYDPGQELFGPYCHGTSRESAGDILQEGLLPPGESGRYGPRGGHVPGEPDRVYLAALHSDPDVEPRCFAFGEGGGDDDVVVLVTLTAEDAPKLLPDDDAVSPLTGTVSEDDVEAHCVLPLLEMRGRVLSGDWAAGPVYPISDDIAYGSPHSVIGRMGRYGRGTRLLQGWLESNPPDREVREVCHGAPEWWKSLAVQGTLAHEGPIPPDRVRRL